MARASCLPSLICFCVLLAVCHLLVALFLPPPLLAADWSYACIEYVSSLADPRNLATLALYAALAYVGLAARPWRVLQEWSGRREVRRRLGQGEPRLCRADGVRALGGARLLLRASPPLAP